MSTSAIQASRKPALALFAVLTAICLGVSAYVHLDLASNYKQVRTSTISQEDIFRIQGIVVILVGVAVLVAAGFLDGRIAALLFVVAALTMAGSLAAVLITRYNDTGKIGFIPDMYEPIWYFKKSLSAYFEGAGVLLALGGASVGLLKRKPVSAVSAASTDG